MRMTPQKIRSSRLLVLATLLLGSVLARQDTSLNMQITRMAGTGLTSAQCRERMQQLGTLLEGAGYGAARTQRLSDGTLAARWYNQTTKRTALAFSGQNAAGNAFFVGEHDGLIRWNELILLP